MLQFLGLNIGVMQGRLLPKFEGRFQAHPLGYWQEEFVLAKDMGFSHIEFILDYNDYLKNPLLNTDGLKEIHKYASENHVKVRSICADYFMEAPLHAPDENKAKESRAVMSQLINAAGEIGVECIVLPCVDQSSVKTEKEKIKLIDSLNELSKSCAQKNVTISLEMDLNPGEFHSLLKELPEEITVNYDTGNSASLGYEITEEFDAYGERISDIHIKDRVLGGGSVELGKGNADFGKVIQAMKKVKYNGIVVMQAYRDEEGLQVLRTQLQTLKKLEQQYA